MGAAQIPGATPTDAAPGFRWTSDRSLRVSLGEGTSDAVGRRTLASYRALRAAEIPGVEDVTPAYATVLVTFSLAGFDALRAEDAVRGAVARGADAEDAPSRTVEVPVCYEGDLAPDLDEVARLVGLSREEVVGRHAAAEYRVRFLGFSPGFPYLAGLPPELEVPRLSRPRVRVPAGSVAVAGGQAGIYPEATPGGWRILGRTPLVLFDPSRASPALLAPGDRVRFAPLSRERFEALLVP